MSLSPASVADSGVLRRVVRNWGHRVQMPAPPLDPKSHGTGSADFRCFGFQNRHFIESWCLNGGVTRTDPREICAASCEAVIGNSRSDAVWAPAPQWALGPLAAGACLLPPTSNPHAARARSTRLRGPPPRPGNPQRESRSWRHPAGGVVLPSVPVKTADTKPFARGVACVKSPVV